MKGLSTAAIFVAESKLQTVHAAQLCICSKFRGYCIILKVGRKFQGLSVSADWHTYCACRLHHQLLSNIQAKKNTAPVVQETTLRLGFH